MSKNRLNLIIAIVGSGVILMSGGLLFNQICKNYQANELIIEKCFENFDNVEKVVIQNDGSGAPLTCEKK